jgi:hypothetical protein
MAIVPSDEIGGGMTTFEILTGDSDSPVGLSTGSPTDLVVVLTEISPSNMPSDLDVAEEAEPSLGCNLLEGARHLLDALVIRSHAKAHQAERSRKSLKHINANGQAFLPQ